jgi:hypothetical protein
MMFLFFKGTTEIGNDAKLDDAYLKMKRLDKALEEAFEKEKQVKIETMSLMKKYVSQRLKFILNDDSIFCLDYVVKCNQ